jgi:hypothetical protein
MAGYKPVRRLGVGVLVIALGEHVFLVRLKHGKAPYLFEIPRQAAFSGNDAG